MSIAFLIFKLYIFKVFCTNSASMKWPFLGRFWALTPQILPHFPKISTTRSIQGNKNSHLRIFEKLKFLQKRAIPRVCTFSPTLTPFPRRRRWAKSKKKKKKRILGETIQPLGYPKIAKSKGISSPLQMKNIITFRTFWAFFGENLSEVKSERIRMKI